MMNVITPNSSPTELVIDFNAMDTVSVTFDESELSMKPLRSQDSPLKVRQDKTLAVDDSTAATVASSASFLTMPSKKSVSFGSLSIHSHYVELGGSGVPGCGPSIGLGWEVESEITLDSVEEYEDARPFEPRRGAEMMHPKKQRVNLLLESGYTLNQIRSCTEELEAIRKQRTKTVQQVTRADRMNSKLKKLAVWKKE